MQWNKPSDLALPLSITQMLLVKAAPPFGEPKGAPLGSDLPALLGDSRNVL